MACKLQLPNASLGLMLMAPLHVICDAFWTFSPVSLASGRCVNVLTCAFSSLPEFSLRDLSMCTNSLPTPVKLLPFSYMALNFFWRSMFLNRKTAHYSNFSYLDFVFLYLEPRYWCTAEWHFPFLISSFGGKCHWDLPTESHMSSFPFLVTFLQSQAGKTDLISPSRTAFFFQLSDILLSPDATSQRHAPLPPSHILFLTSKPTSLVKIAT